MTTATINKTTAPSHVPAFSTEELRADAVRAALVGQEYRPGEHYTEEEVELIIKSPNLQELLLIDGELLQNAMEHGTSKEAVEKELNQFKMRLAYVVSALTIGRMAPHKGLRTEPWVLAVTKTKLVRGEFGQTITVSTDISAPLWTQASDQVGKTLDLRSRYRGTMVGYEVAENINFFEVEQSYDKPLLVKGIPTVLEDGSPMFVITELCIDATEATAIKKAREATAAAVVAEAKRVKREAAAAKKAEAAKVKAEKALLRKAKAAEKKTGATKAPRKRKAKVVGKATVITEEVK